MPEPDTSPDLVKAQELGLTVNVWRGHNNYKCPHCALDSLDLGKMEKHLLVHNPPEPPKPPSLIIQVDRYGNPTGG